MTDQEKKESNRDAWFRTAISSGLTVAAAILAFTVQWGAVSAQIEGLDRRLDEIVIELRQSRENYAELSRRISFLEGQMMKATTE